MRRQNFEPEDDHFYKFFKEDLANYFVNKNRAGDQQPKTFALRRPQVRLVVLLGKASGKLLGTLLEALGGSGIFSVCLKANTFALRRF